MKSENQHKWKMITMLSLLCFLIPASIFILWLKVFNLGKTQAERVALFQDYFPDFLAGRWDTTIICIIFSGIAVTLSIMGLMRLKKTWKLINIVILICSGFLFIITSTSMM